MLRVVLAQRHVLDYFLLALNDIFGQEALVALVVEVHSVQSIFEVFKVRVHLCYQNASVLLLIHELSIENLLLEGFISVM